ncbi:MAG: hypothetical protein JXB40_01855 [Candidatus Omnitrophica bacterium]|nr:hypothetical protein [Candidatus Omnitrophota bacterium]
MKKNVLAVLFIAICLVSLRVEAHADTETELLVKMLVENGTLTKEQANLLASTAAERVAKESKERSDRELRERAVKKAEEAAPAQTEIRTGKDISAEAAKKWEITARPVETSWDNALTFKTSDSNFEIKLIGRTYADMLYVDGQSTLTELLRNQGDFLRRNDQAFIRSARLGLEGKIYEDFLFKFEYDFYGDINTKTEVDGLKSAYVGMEHIPFVGELKIGHMKEPFSLEELDSFNDITFLERSLPNVFAPGYDWGICMNNAWFDERITFAAGAFRNSVHSGTMVSGNEWSATTRLTGLPWYEGQGRLMHLGAAYSYRVPESGGWNNTNENIRFRSQPELWTRDYVLDTGNFEINSENLLGAEAAVVYGPLSIQGEVIDAWINSPRDQLSTRGNLYGAYAYISYILTGESREYSTSRGEFRSVTPKHVFSFRDRTWGAWEVAARCSYLNLDDKNLGISGGSLVDATIGLNWYLNPNMRLMVNWVHADRAGYGALDGIQTRAQWDFE